MTITLDFPLQLAKGQRCELSRIGYEDEGVRLTFYDKKPFRIHTEVQLSRLDVEHLISGLKQSLEENEDLK